MKVHYPYIIESTSGFPPEPTSRAEIARQILNSRRMVVGARSTGETEPSLDFGKLTSSPISRGPFAPDELADDEDAEWARSSSNQWRQVSEIYSQVYVGPFYYASGAGGSTSFGAKLTEFKQVHEVRLLAEIADELAAEIPEEEWDRIPTDLVRNFDHYLYGAPKDEE